MDGIKRIAVFCVGNMLMADDGLGHEVYERLMRDYKFNGAVQRNGVGIEELLENPESQDGSEDEAGQDVSVDIFDVGCMSMDMINYVDRYDYIITIDALDGTGADPGTVFEFSPEDIAPRTQMNASLHELTLADLMQAAALLGFHAKGKCFGIQVENGSPSVMEIGLSPSVEAAIPLLIDALLADLASHGAMAGT